MPKTKFRPAVDGFAFINDWSFTPEERDALKARLRELIPAATALLLAVPAVGVLVPAAPIAIPIALLVIIDNAVPERHGRCSGMAFSALDYFVANLVAARGNAERVPPPGARLRDYIWQRTVEATAANGLRWLQWMFMMHVVSDRTWLRDRSFEEWAVLKSHIDRGDPWPIGLMGEANDPFDNHVVLAYGYEDTGDGRATVYLYDPNCPNNENATTFDFRGRELGSPTREDCSNRHGHTAGGAVPGFFCQAYGFCAPPVAVGLSHGMGVSPGPEVRLGTTSGFSYEARNYGWGPTPPLALYGIGRPRSNPGEVRDVSNGPGLSAIAEGGSRWLSTIHRFEGSIGPRGYTAQCYLGNVGGVEVWKRVPQVEPGTVASLDLLVREALPPTPVPTPATRYFVHRADASNTRGNSTNLNHPLVNRNPNAALLVTPNFNPGGAGGVYNPHSVGVYFAGGQQWAIFNEDRADMPIGAAFNVEVLDTSDPSDPSVGLHSARSDNTSGHVTTINSGASNDLADAIVSVTQNWNPRGSAVGIYNPHAIGVYYAGNRWAIFNQDIAAIPLQSSFNLKVSRPGAASVVHIASAANTRSHITYIDHPASSRRPDAVLLVTPNWNPPGASGVYNSHPTGVWYDLSRQQWSIFNQDFAPMPLGSAFNIELR